MPCVVLGYILLAIGTIFLVRPCSPMHEDQTLPWGIMISRERS